MKHSDAILVKNTLEGDDSAFRTLINRHRGVVYGLCYHFVHNFTDAEDLTQETFIRAYFKLPSLSDPAKFLSWLRQITINICHNWIRRQKDNSIPLDAISKQPDISSSPEEIYKAKKLQEIVAEAIASLSEKNRQVVMLYYLNGQSCKEVADFLDVSVSVVQSRLYEARRKLKGELIAMVEGDLENKKLTQDFDEKVLKAIEQAGKANNQRDYGEVIKHCDKALSILTKLPDSVDHKSIKFRALWMKSDAISKHASKEEGIKYLEEILEYERKIGDKSSQALIIEKIANHYGFYAGNAEKAVEYYKQALEMFEEIENKFGQARVLDYLGSQSLPNHNVEDGIAYYQKAFDLYKEMGMKNRACTCHAALNLLQRISRHLDKISLKAGLPKEALFGVVFFGVVCEEFSKSSETIVYIGKGGIQGSYTWSGSYGDYVWTNKDEVKYTLNASPFRFMPETTKILDFSLTVGDSWSMKVPSTISPREQDFMKITVTIESNSETVSVPAGVFTNCLKMKMVTSEEPEGCEYDRSGIREFIYAPGVGLVKSTYIRRDGAIGIAQLMDYTVSGSNKDCFPLVLGNKWSYEWMDKESSFPTMDVYEVLEMDDSRYYVSHYYYALKIGKVLVK